MHIFFSVITVCYNSEKTIRQAIESILNQCYLNFEYIIIDGKSSDRTVTIARDYKERFAALQIDYFINSEEDNGIFDAMNKGVALSRGDYVVFLNSDDSFYDNRVLEHVNKIINDHRSPDIVVGRTKIIGNGRNYIQKPPHILFEDKLLGRMPFIHQSSFSKRCLLENNPFSTKYKVSSDYDFFLKQRLQNKRFYVSDLIFSNYSYDGVSSKIGWEFIKTEYTDIKKRNINIYNSTTINRIKIYIFSFIYDIRMSLLSIRSLRILFFCYKNGKNESN